MQALNNGVKWLTSANRVSNFSLKETECSDDCGLNDVRQGLVDVLQSIRDYLGTPVTITCALRCPAQNRRTDGSVKGSYHMQGMAADIAVRDDTGTYMTSEALFDAIKFLSIPCVIKYPGHRFVHVDIRITNAPVRMVKNPQGIYIPV